MALQLACTAALAASTAAAFRTAGDLSSTGNEKRIIGGELAKEGDFPFLVNLRYQWQQANGTMGEFVHRCGGSLLNANTVLTAAHCWEDYHGEVSRLMVRVNSLDGTTGGVTSNVTEVVRHSAWEMPGEDDPDMGYDIALWRLETPIKAEDGIEYACLPKQKSEWPANGTDARLAGWGEISNSDDSEFQDLLRKVTVPIMGKKDCSEAYSKGDSPEEIHNDMICSGEPGKGICDGDSGGPVVVDGVVVGVNSFGVSDCGDPDFPAVSTRVAYYLDWIAENSW